MGKRCPYRYSPGRRHPKSSHANTTVATDGRHVIAFFGSEGLYCYDMEGKLLWERDFGLINSSWHIVETAEWEFCSSPVIFQDKVVIQADALNTAFVAVLDLHSGETLWRQERDEISGLVHAQYLFRWRNNHGWL